MEEGMILMFLLGLFIGMGAVVFLAKFVFDSLNKKE